MQFDQLKRRKFITLLGYVAAGWSIAARSQQGQRARRIGVVDTLGADDSEAQVRNGALLRGLQQQGWTSRNVRQTKCVQDPVAGLSQATSIVGSADRRQGPILETVLQRTRRGRTLYNVLRAADASRNQG
jgi:hypothetical protein